MRLMVYPEEGGTVTVLAVPSPGAGKVPVLVKGIARRNIKTTVLPVVLGMRKDAVVPASPE